MMDLHLPGRDYESEDYEAQSALRTLMEADKIKHCGDEELWDRIAEQLQYNLGMLERVSALVDSLSKGGEDDADEDDDSEETFAAEGGSTPERTDTRTIEDFLVRINKVRKKEHEKNLQPLKGAKRYG